MWIMLPTGFVSIVEKPEDVENDTLTVRSRDVRSLAAFCALAQVAPEEAITETGGTDYPFRVVMSRSQVSIATRAAVEDIDYSNFKTRAKKVSGGAYERFLMKVWVAGLSLTPWQVADRLDLAYRAEDWPS